MPFAITTDGRRRGALLLATIVAIVLAESRFRGQPANTPGITRTPLFGNARAAVLRVTFAPGAKEAPHTHPVDILVIQDTPGHMDLTVSGKLVATGLRGHGMVSHVAKGTQHWAANTGKEPFDLIVVQLK